MTDGSLDDLMRGVVDRDAEAIGALYDATSSRVFALALLLVRDRRVAEEVTLDVFTRIWRQPDHFDPESGPLLPRILGRTRARAVAALRPRVRPDGGELSGRRRHARAGVSFRELAASAEHPAASGSDVV